MLSKTLLLRLLVATLSVGFVAVGNFFGNASLRAAEKDNRRDQLQSPTHRQIRLIEPKIDGKTLKLHTIATTPEGHLLAAIGGESMQHVMSDDGGYETEVTQQPAVVLMLNTMGETLQSWEIDITPSALAVAPNGSIYVGGSGQVARLSPDGEVSLLVDSPHVGDRDQLRTQAAKAIRESRAQMSDVFSEQIEVIHDRIDEIEDKDEDDRSRLEEAQLKAFKSQLEMMEKMTGGADGEDAEVSEAEIDAAVTQSMAITSMAASDQDVFVCASGVGLGGYSVWRIAADLELETAEVILEGLRGCCGQMDIECCDGNLMVSENTSFRVGIYDRHGRSIAKFGKRDRTSRAGFGSCCNPMNSLAMSDGTIVTAESSIGHLKRFDTEGNLIAYIGKAAIGAGCKHCALGHDEENDIYYMMYQDKNAICVMGNRESSPVTPEEMALQQKQIDFLARAAGHWSVKSPDEKKKPAGLLSWFGGGRGGSSQHPVSSLKIEPDGSAKILEGMYQAYGDKSSIEMLEDTVSTKDDSDFYRLALSIDQVRFLQGNWKFTNQDTVELEFTGFPAVTLARSESSEDCESNCAGKLCENKNCEDKNCPKSNHKTDVKIVTAKMTAQDTDEVAEVSPSEMAQAAGLEAVFTSARQIEYKVVTRKQLGENSEATLNELGKQGWDFCHRLGKKMVFKRSRNVAAIFEVEQETGK